MKMSRETKTTPRGVLVLGDFGHSPSDAESRAFLVKKGHEVTVIAYKNGSMMKETLRKHKGKKWAFSVRGYLSIELFTVKISRMPFVPSIVYFAFRVVLQFVQVLLCLLFETGRVKVTDVMVQKSRVYRRFWRARWRNGV